MIVVDTYVWSLAFRRQKKVEILSSIDSAD